MGWWVGCALLLTRRRPPTQRGRACDASHGQLVHTTTLAAHDSGTVSRMEASSADLFGSARWEGALRGAGSEDARLRGIFRSTANARARDAFTSCTCDASCLDESPSTRQSPHARLTCGFLQVSASISQGVRTSVSQPHSLFISGWPQGLDRGTTRPQQQETRRDGGARPHKTARRCSHSARVRASQRCSIK